MYSVAPLSAGSMPPVGGAWDAIHHRGGGACVKPEGEKGLSLSHLAIANREEATEAAQFAVACYLSGGRGRERKKERKGKSPFAAVAVVGVADTIFVLRGRVVIYLGGGGA